MRKTVYHNVMRGHIVTPVKKPRLASAPLCEVRGHSWEKTVSDKVMRCNTSGCNTVRMLIHGHWKHFQFSQKRSTTQLIEMQALREQMVLWESEENQ